MPIIDLDPDLRELLQTAPSIRVVDSVTGQDYYLVPAERYENRLAASRLNETPFCSTSAGFAA